MDIVKINGVKTVFVPAKVKNVDLSVLKKLKIKEKRVGLVSAVQYLDYLNEAKKYLEEQGKEVEIAGQIIGCNAYNAIKIKNKVDCYVFIGSGEFHPLELVDSTKVSNIYFVNPTTKVVSKFGKEDLEKLEKKRQGKIKKYLMADKIGILVSSKPGQEKLKKALEFAESCKKEAYVFLDNEIDINRLEDFNDIKMWVNTACPRLEGNNIISLRDVLSIK